MQHDTRKLPVNWVDGMKISRDHFIHQDHAHAERINKMSRLLLSPTRYGILPSQQGQTSYDVRISVDQQRFVHVAVSRILAVTPGGCIIDIDASFSIPGADVQTSAGFLVPDGARNTTMWLFVIVNPLKGIAVGEPELHESPPRYPFIVPDITYELVLNSDFRQYAGHPYALPIGKLKISEVDVRIQEFTPPCFALNSLNELIIFCTDVEHFFSELESRCGSIINNISRRNQDNDIARMVNLLCDQMVVYAGNAITNLLWTIKEASPALLFALVAGLARNIKNTIDLRLGSGKEDLLNYFAEWHDLTPGELDAVLRDLASLQYNIFELHETMGKLSNFMRPIQELFKTLSELEFIGKRKKAVETFIKVEEATPRRRFLG